MKAYVYIKHKSHPQVNGQGIQRGDICYIYPIVADQGKLTLDTYVPIVMDLNIPCGQGQVAGMNYTVIGNNAQYRCVECPFNDVLLCDVIKYMSAEWTAGDVVNPPVVSKTRRHKVDIDTLYDATSLILISKEGKTEAEKATIYSNATKNEQLKTIVTEKNK